jgi:DNA adenine methylase
LIKSPLRYPGGKSKAIEQIIKYIPANFQEYREPFVGGGSLFIYLKQIEPNLNIWINDLNSELFYFWQHCRDHLCALATSIQKIKDESESGRELFHSLTHLNVEQLSDFDRAVRFFILNRITFSGTVESGGYSEQSYQRRFTNSSIDRVLKMREILADIKITNLDYQALLSPSDTEVFIFLDPPYYSATKSRLYGKNGTLHTEFDHHRLAENLKSCPHQWLITYDDSPQIRELFDFAQIYPWELQYGMNNYQQGRAAKGKELFICNYDPELDQAFNRVSRTTKKYPTFLARDESNWIDGCVSRDINRWRNRSCLLKQCCSNLIVELLFKFSTIACEC